MKTLIVGAGALGGYFGARLLEAGRDVTFLLRPRRAAAIAQTGLVVRSPHGDLTIPAPPHVDAETIPHPYDLVVVACKAFDLDATMASFAPAVGERTAILPLLNGMRHLDALKDRFGDERVLGGLCMISATLDAAGAVLHLNDSHLLAFGELGEQQGVVSPRVRAIEAEFAPARFDARASADIERAMWEKWVFIASTAGITTLMRAAIGDIVSAGAADLALTLLHECSAIAASHGFEPSVAANERARTVLTDPGSKITASMLKDLERGGPIEADHIIGDLLSRAATDALPALLPVVLANLKAYEARRAREAGAGA